MNSEIPELFSKLSEQDIEAAPTVGTGADLRKLFNFLRLFGVFGRSKNSNRYISHRLYKTYPGPYKDRKGTIHPVDDQYAYDRIDNIVSGKLPLTEHELDYIRLCLCKAFRDNIAATISDDEILKGQAHMLVRRLLSDTPKLTWDSIDPLYALLSLAAASEPLALDLNLFGEDKRLPDDRPKDEAGYIFHYNDPDIQLLHQGSRFTLSIPKEEARTEPLVLAWSEETGRTTSSNIEARAAKMRHVVRTEDKTGPWRVSKPNNKPIVIPDTDNGRFGFLAIADMGRSIDQLFPEGCDIYALVNSDLKHLYEQLTLIITSGDIPKMGIIQYEVR